MGRTRGRPRPFTDHYDSRSTTQSVSIQGDNVHSFCNTPIFDLDVAGFPSSMGICCGSVALYYNEESDWRALGGGPTGLSSNGTYDIPVTITVTAKTWWASEASFDLYLMEAGGMDTVPSTNITPKFTPSPNPSPTSATRLEGTWVYTYSTTVRVVVAGSNPVPVFGFEPHITRTSPGFGLTSIAASIVVGKITRVA